MSLGQATKPRWASWLRISLSVGVSLGLLIAVFGSLDVDRIKALFTGSHPAWFMGAALLVPLQVYLGASRWRRVSVDLDMDLSLRRAIEEYGLSVLLNQVLPGGMAGDATRVWRHKQGHGSFAAPLRAAVVDRVIGHWAHLFVTAVGLVVWAPLHGVASPSGSGTLVAVVVLVFAVLWTRPIPGLRALVSDTRRALATSQQLAFHTGTSVLLVATFLFSFWLCAQGLGLPLGWAALTAVPLLMLVMVIPLSLGGWGLREVSAAVVLSFLGWSTEESIALSAAYGIVNLMGALPAVAVLLRPAAREAAA